MKILNKNNQNDPKKFKFITERHDHETQLTNYHEKISHMLSQGYGSIVIEDKTVAYDHEYEVDGERYIVVNVE